MNQQVIRNSEGEPIGVEYVRNQFEEEEAFCEEMQMRAEDPMYAAQQEDAYWYQQACACFEEKGIQVPPSVIYTLKKELRKKEQKRQEEKALEEVAPTLDYLNSKLPRCEFYADYYPETCDEYAHVEIGCKNRPYVWELAEVISGCSDEEWDKGISIEDYFGYGNCKTMIGYLNEGKGYDNYVRNWTAKEHCGQDMLFALRNDWLTREDWDRDERYLKAIWAIKPTTDACGNSNYDAFRKAYPQDQYTIWFGEIIHNKEFDDTICFHWS